MGYEKGLPCKRRLAGENVTYLVWGGGTLYRCNRSANPRSWSTIPEQTALAQLPPGEPISGAAGRL